MSFAFFSPYLSLSSRRIRSYSHRSCLLSSRRCSASTSNLRTSFIDTASSSIVVSTLNNSTECVDIKPCLQLLFWGFCRLSHDFPTTATKCRGFHDLTHSGRARLDMACAISLAVGYTHLIDSTRRSNIHPTACLNSPIHCLH